MHACGGGGGDEGGDLLKYMQLRQLCLRLDATCMHVAGNAGATA